MTTSHIISLSCLLMTIQACASAVPRDADALPCIPYETRCVSLTTMSECTADGLSRDVIACDAGDVCLSDVPGAHCEPQAPRRTVQENLDATMSVQFFGVPACTGVLVADDVVLTNEHCCRDADCSMASVVARYRSFESGSPDDVFEVQEVIGIWPEYDAVALRVSDELGERHRPVAFAAPRRDRYVGETIYLPGHPSGRPLETTLGFLLHYDSEVTFSYLSGPRTKNEQVFSSASARPGSSGSPVFLLETGELVALHHSGGLDPTEIGLSEDATDGFTSLLAATVAPTIEDALRAVGVMTVSRHR